MLNSKIAANLMEIRHIHELLEIEKYAGNKKLLDRLQKKECETRELIEKKQKCCTKKSNDLKFIFSETNGCQI